MASVEERLALLEDKLGHPLPADQRLDKIEAQLRRPPKKDAWEKLQAASSVGTAIVTALVGFWLTGKVSVALERSRLSLDYVKEMRQLVVDLGKSKLDASEARADAFALASYGAPALPALVHLLRTGGDVSLDAVREGFRTFAYSDPEPACKQLAGILTNRTRLFSWRHHQHALGLLADLGCRCQLPVIDDYAKILAACQTDMDIKAFNKNYAATGGDPPLDRESLRNLNDRLVLTLEVLRATGGSGANH